MTALTSARRAVVAALFVSLIAVPAAFAHAHLRRSVPAANGRLAEPPRELRLTFSEPPSLAFTRVTLVSARGDTVALDPLVLSPRDRATIVSAIVGAVGAGRYTVRWQVAGDDGHPTRGEFAFAVDSGAAPSGAAPSGAATDTALPSTPTLAPATSPMPAADTTPLVSAEDTSLAESAQAIAGRWLTSVGLLGVFGAVAFTFTVLPRVERVARDGTATATLVAPARARAASWGAAGVGILLVGAMLRLFAQRAAIGAPLVPMLTSTVWGWGWALQVVAAVVALTGFTRASRASRERRAPSRRVDARGGRSRPPARSCSRSRPACPATPRRRRCRC